jgi:hypothetical protein
MKRSCLVEQKRFKAARTPALRREAGGERQHAAANGCAHLLSSGL